MGYGTRVGIPGVYYPATAHPGERFMTAKRAPEAPARGLEWVVMKLGRTLQQDPPCGPGQHPAGASLVLPPLSSQTAV